MNISWAEMSRNLSLVSLAHKHKHKHMSKQVKLGRHKYEHKAKKNGHVRSSCAYAYACACVVALTSENSGVDICTGITTSPWTIHRSLWPRPHANISKAIWRTLRAPSCFSSGWRELVSRIESNLPFCACVCPYAYAYALVKTKHNEHYVVWTSYGV